jgi:hypothetical protein
MEARNLLLELVASFAYRAKALIHGEVGCQGILLQDKTRYQEPAVFHLEAVGPGVGPDGQPLGTDPARCTVDEVGDRQDDLR